MKYNSYSENQLIFKVKQITNAMDSPLKILLADNNDLFRRLEKAFKDMRGKEIYLQTHIPSLPSIFLLINLEVNFSFIQSLHDY